MLANKRTQTQIIVQVIVFVVKLGFAILLVGWLFSQRRFNLSLITQLRLTVQSITLFSAAAIFVIAGLLIMSWRFELLLRHAGFSITFREVVGLTFIGSFFGAVLPGLIGGDVVKAVYLCRSSTYKRSEALTAVMVDRLIGLYALISLAVLALPIVSLWHLTELDKHIQFLVMALWVGVTLGGLAIVSCTWARIPAFQHIQSRLPHSLRNLIQALITYAEAPKLVIISIFLSIVNHLLVVLSFWMVGLVIGDSISFFGHLVINPLAMLLNAIPLAPGGVGITESGFSLLFEHAGSPNGATIGLLGRIVQYVVFTLGGIPALFLLNIRRTSVELTKAIPDIKETVNV